jgi:hypothetical protein
MENVLTFLVILSGTSFLVISGVIKPCTEISDKTCIVKSKMYNCWSTQWNATRRRLENTSRPVDHFIPVQYILFHKFINLW